MVRDPRIDPQRGDWTLTRRKHHELTEDCFWLVLLRSTDGQTVYYMDHNGYFDCTDLSGWQQWSKDDEVLYVAGNVIPAGRFDGLERHAPDCGADELAYEIDQLVSMAKDRGRVEVAALLKKALAQAVKEGEDGRG